jgi:hypothetical protein
MHRSRAARTLTTAAALAAAALAAPSPAAAQATDAESLVRAMHARYADTWYSTLAFPLTVVRWNADGTTLQEEWREWISIPGRLRLDMGPLTAIFDGDSSFVLNEGRPVRRREARNELLTIGFDVYRQPPEATLEQLRRQGIDTGRFHAGTLEGVPVYVIGAEAGDTLSKQVAIEADRLLFVRLRMPGAQGRVSDVWARGYEPLGGGWIAPEVEFRENGRVTTTQRYFDVRVDEPLDDALFDPDAQAPAAEAAP